MLRFNLWLTTYQPRFHQKNGVGGLKDMTRAL